MNARVELVKGKGGLHRRWYYRLIAGNGRVLSTSETYWSKWNAKRAAKKVAIERELPLLEVER